MAGRRERGAEVGRSAGEILEHLEGTVLGHALTSLIVGLYEG